MVAKAISSLIPDGIPSNKNISRIESAYQK
jgi:hypothetical protein